MKYVSVCAGIEAATVAWHPLGWEPVLFSEIEPFPCAVLKHHYPDVPLVGDFTQLLDQPPEADLLVGGTPCQAFSVAGKRLSLEDYRGNLSLAFADLFHAGRYRWAVWENVPGVLSTKDNAFGCLLGRLVGHDAPLQPGRGNRWTNAGVVSGPLATAAWRVLDAQYFGVAQRRRRVFVCVSRGAGNWAAAEALLPVGECVSRHPPARPKAGEGTAATAPRSLALRGRDGGATAELGDEVGNALRASQGGGDKAHILAPDVARSLRGRGNDPHRADAATYVVGGGGERTISGTLTARMVQSLGARDVEEGAVVVGALDTECGFNKATDQTVRNGHILAVPDRTVAPPLTAGNDPSRSPQSSEVTAQVAAVVEALAVPQILRNREGKAGGGKGPLLSENQSLTLGTANDQVVFALTTEQTPKFAADIALTVTKGSPTGGGHPQAVVAPSVTGGPPFSRTGNERVEADALVMGFAQNQRGEVRDLGDVSAAVTTGGGKPGEGYPAVLQLRPRRLTPRECERLQAFPDDYSLIPWKKGTAPDSLRYRALGNSMCVNVMRWIGKRIAAVDHA